MSSASKLGPLAALAAMVLAMPPLRSLAATDVMPLRVCADPNNLPFSNQRGDGFENRIATLVARDLGRPLAYYFQPQRRGFARSTLNAGRCDLIVGVLTGSDRVLTTRPYYRSTFVFVSRPAGPVIRSFDDRRLARLRVGIQLTGDDYGNPPPAQALASRGLAAVVRGFPVYGDYSHASPLRTIVDAVAANEIDAAAVWGPVGGYFAAREQQPLVVTPITPERRANGITFAFSIAMAVRTGDGDLKQRLDTVIRRRQPDIDRILRRFNVPVLAVDTDARRVS
jgi:quinoprotein dehydrogenase-associated probable ABC transporter substrate-binding protein